MSKQAVANTDADLATTPGSGESCSLPTADFSSSDEEQQQELSDGHHQVNVFSRSTHIQSLGLLHYEASPELDLEADSTVNLEPNMQNKIHEIPVSDLGNSSGEAQVEFKPSEYEDCYGNKHRPDEIALKSWDDFKTEFADTLKSSEAQIASGQLGNRQEPSPSTDIRQDILIEMITSLHDSRNLPLDIEAENEDTAPPKPSQGSPTRPRKQLLSLTTLETIHESEIDRLLVKVEGTASEQNEVDGDVFCPAESNVQSLPPSSPHRKLSYPMIKGSECSSSGDKNDDLMKQLCHLSLAQTTGHGQMGKESCESSSPGISDVAKQLEPVKEAKPTVLLDLRPVNLQFGGPNQRDSESSDDQQDAYAWAQERKVIKSNLEAHFTPSTPPHDPPPSSHHTSSTPPHDSSSSTHHTPSTPPHDPSPSSTPPRDSSSSTHHTPSSSHNLHTILHSKKEKSTD